MHLLPLLLIALVVLPDKHHVGRFCIAMDHGGKTGLDVSINGRRVVFQTTFPTTSGHVVEFLLPSGQVPIRALRLYTTGGNGCVRSVVAPIFTVQVGEPVHATGGTRKIQIATGHPRQFGHGNVNAIVGTIDVQRVWHRASNGVQTSGQAGGGAVKVCFAHVAGFFSLVAHGVAIGQMDGFDDEVGGGGGGDIVDGSHVGPQGAEFVDGAKGGRWVGVGGGADVRKEGGDCGVVLLFVHVVMCVV